MAGQLLYRIQDREGRGPWRPGFSAEWLELDSDRPLPVPITSELANFHSLVKQAHQRRMHIGCAVRGLDGLAKWFLPSELAKLRELGFRLVRCSTCEILAETPNQVLFASKAPLARLPRVSWPSLELLEAA